MRKFSQNGALCQLDIAHNDNHVLSPYDHNHSECIVLSGGCLSVNKKSINPQLFRLVGLYRPFLYHILRQNLPAEQWRVRIMRLRIARNGFQTVRSITIPAPVGAGVLHTNVDPCHAATFRALVLVFLQ